MWRLCNGNGRGRWPKANRGFRAPGYSGVIILMAGLATFDQNNAPALVVRRGWLPSAYNLSCLSYVKCSKRLKNVRAPDGFPHRLKVIRKGVSDWFYKWGVTSHPYTKT